jgi:NAD(P)-dependent dehydrogenase (short-subunit alcohol dehydrogenase family)
MLSVMGEFEGKVAIVTGAGGNIGSVTSRMFAEAGARVMMTDIAEEPLAKAAEAIQADGFEVISMPGDVGSEADVRAVVAKTIDAYGGVDIMDNTAGVTNMSAGEDAGVTTMDVAIWDSIFNCNVKGPMLYAKHTIPSMVQRGGGVIINISSGLSLAGNDYFVAYGSSKGALNTLTKYVATAHGAQGIRCNALALGVIVRPNIGDVSAGATMNDYLKHHIVGRLGRAEDIANTVLFLASDRGAFITGQVISVDGGFYAHLPTFPG